MSQKPFFHIYSINTPKYPTPVDAGLYSVELDAKMFLILSFITFARFSMKWLFCLSDWTTMEMRYLVFVEVVEDTFGPTTSVNCMKRYFLHNISDFFHHSNWKYSYKFQSAFGMRKECFILKKQCCACFFSYGEVRMKLSSTI